MMADQSGRTDRLVDDPRLSPPKHIRPALAEAEAVARVGTRWNEHQTVELVLKVWARVIDDIGSYRPYGADDYMHDISFRIRLDRFVAVLNELGHHEALCWLASEVDRLDKIFVERSIDDVDDLMLRNERSNPDHWYLRRLPNDKNVIDHLASFNRRRRRSSTNPRRGCKILESDLTTTRLADTESPCNLDRPGRARISNVSFEVGSRRAVGQSAWVPGVLDRSALAGGCAANNRAYGGAGMP